MRIFLHRLKRSVIFGLTSFFLSFFLLLAPCPPLAELERRLPGSPQLPRPDPQSSLQAHVDGCLTCSHRLKTVCFCFFDTVWTWLRPQLVAALSFIGIGNTKPERKNILLEQKSWEDEMGGGVGSGCSLWKLDPVCLSVCLHDGPSVRPVSRSAGTDCS